MPQAGPGEIELVWNLLEILPEEINIKDIAQERQNQSQIDLELILLGVGKTEIGHRYVIGDDHHLSRYHHRRQKDGEKDLPSPEVELGKSKSRQNRDNKTSAGGA